MWEWIVQNKQWVFSGAGITVLGVLWWLVAKFWPKREAATSTTQAPNTSIAPVITMNPTINFPIEPRAPEPPKQVAPPAPEVPAAPKPNFQFVESRTISAHRGLQDEQFHESRQGLGDFQVSVVCFRNEAIVGKAVQEPSVKTHIIYKNKNGEEITDAPRGVWLGHYGDTISFEAGQKRCLVVFLLSKQNTVMKPWNESYRTSQSWMSSGRPSFRIQTDGISDVASVEVTFLAGDVCLLRAVFDSETWINRELPKLVLRSISEG